MFPYYGIMVMIYFNPVVNAVLQNKEVKKITTRSAYGKYLKDYVFKTTKGAIDPQHCLSDCWEENGRCQSFNFLVTSRECELNEASDETAPGKLVDRSNVVYLRNPAFGRERAPKMARHTKQYPSIDPCKSNPCTHAATCVLNSNLGYLCKDCHYGYVGPKCEELADLCDLINNPCQFGGTCVAGSNMKYTCACRFPHSSTNCTKISADYFFKLDGKGKYPTYNIDSSSLSTYRTVDYFTAIFWFKIPGKIGTSYFLSFQNNNMNYEERFSVWRVGNTFSVELWENVVYNFAFSNTNAVDDDQWHHVAITVHRKYRQKISFYLDGVMREKEKEITRKGLYYNFKSGQMRLGFFKDSSGTNHSFNGSISNFDIHERLFTSSEIQSHFVRKCTPSNFPGLYEGKIWTEFQLIRRTNCLLRDVYDRNPPRNFRTRTISTWLEQVVSPPKVLTAFTMIFQILGGWPGHGKAMQMACYSDHGTDCSLSVVIHTGNFTLETTIESTRFYVNLLPIFDGKYHIFVLTWTNAGGMFEFLIDGVLQSTMVNIETGQTITSKNRFMVGGLEGDPDKNYYGTILNFNMWDKILSDDILYTMMTQPGVDDMGNVVAWRDLKKPSSIPTAEFRIEKFIDNEKTHLLNSVGNLNEYLQFSKSITENEITTYGHIWAEVCCQEEAEFTFLMWLRLYELPATLFTFKNTFAENDTAVRLFINLEKKIIFEIENSSISCGNYPNNYRMEWNFLAMTWSNNGDLNVNLNGVYSHISSNFKEGFVFDNSQKSYWTIGGSENGLVGMVAQVNIWFVALPPPALMALSRGINSVMSNQLDLNWKRLKSSSFYIGTVRYSDDVYCYSPDFKRQKLRDIWCNENLDLPCKYRARLGIDTNRGRKLFCFCEENLSEDMNFNGGSGEWSKRLENI